VPCGESRRLACVSGMAVVPFTSLNGARATG
jgi:hypothetical protein